MRDYSGDVIFKGHSEYIYFEHFNADNSTQEDKIYYLPVFNIGCKVNVKFAINYFQVHQMFFDHLAALLVYRIKPYFLTMTLNLIRTNLKELYFSY
jgi:hypothetical protein